MKEAEITCLCSPGVRIADLGLELKRGDVVHLPEDKARRSSHLEMVRRAGGIAVRLVERCREKRAAPIEPSMAPSAPPPREVFLPAPSPSPTFDMAELEDILNRVVSPLIDQVAALRREIASRPVVVAQETVPVSSRASSVPGTVAPDVPVFVPSDLVSSGLKGEITFTEKEQSVGGLDSATEALKALKKKR